MADRAPQRSMIGLALFGSVAAVLLLVLLLWPRDEAPTESRKQPDSPLFLLPRRSVDATAVLGRTRAQVRSVLGTPSATATDSDAFSPGIPFEVRYAEGKATGLSVTVAKAARNERALRRWLHLPSAGPFELEGVRYATDSGTGDDRYSISARVDAPAQTPVATRATAGSIRDLVRAFPRMPPFARGACRAAEAGEGTKLSCPGLGDVEYALSGPDRPEKLVLLDPGGAKDERACARVIDGALAGAVEVQRFDSLGGGATQHYRGIAADAFYIWEPAGSGTPAHCTVEICRSTGARKNPCTAPPTGHERDAKRAEEKAGDVSPPESP